MKYSKSKVIQQLSCFILFVICLMCTINKVHAQGSVNDAQEIAALKALYEKTGNLDESTGIYKTTGGWATKWPVTKPSDWNSITSLSQVIGWHGINISLGDVVMVNLFRNNLTGQIPTEIGALKKVTWMDLGSNELVSPIPQSLTSLPLINLRLYWNRFSGPIPDFSPLAPTLTHLYLDHNSFTGGIPTHLANLTGLLELHIGHNFLTGGLPVGLASLPKLKQLDLDHAGLSGNVPVAFTQMASLTNLDLSYNNFTSLPNFTTLPNKASFFLDVRSNDLDFFSIEQNLTGPNSQSNNYEYKTFYYWPQNVYPVKSMCITAGTTKIINNRAGGVHTTYEWFGSQDRKTFTSLGVTTRDLTLSTATNSYKAFRCAMRNSWITGSFMYSSVFDASAGEGAVNDALEIAALKALYESTGNLNLSTGTYYGTGAGWKNKWPVTSPEDWDELTTYDVAGWHGLTVTCGDVTYIDLEDNSLSGSIPPDLRHLKKLIYLRLNYNNIGGNIPPELSELQNLTRLILSNNTLTKPIPTSLANMGSLQILALQYNNLTGTIPSALGGMESLMILYLYDNNLTGWDPASLFASGNFPNLSIFYFDNNDLGGQLTSSIGGIQKLQIIGLNNTDLTGSIPGSLGNLPDLATLYLNNNSLTGSIPSGFHNFSNPNISIRLENNLLDNIVTGFELSEKLSGDYIENNKFDFGDLERLFTSSGTLPLGAIRYAPQKTVLACPNTDITVNEGEGLEIPFAPAGAQNVYSWEKWNGTAWNPITGATSADYSKPVAALADAGRYRCRVTNNWVTKSSPTYQNLILYSEEVTVTVVSRPDPPVVSSATICSGETATLTAVGTGTIKWYTTLNNLSEVPIFTGPAYATPPLTTDRTYYASQTVSGIESYRASASVTVETITITVLPSNPSCSGVADGTISVTITGVTSAVYNYEIRDLENTLVASGTANNGQEILVQVPNGQHVIRATNPDISCTGDLTVDVNACEGKVPDAIEIAALKALYESTGSYIAGEGWKTKWPVTDASSWNSLTSLDQLCGWNGLTFACGDIIEINMPDNGMQGALPGEVGNLTALEAFRVNTNTLADLPTTFNNLISLKFLDVAYNTLSSFPEVVLELPVLESLNLIGNSIENIPVGIGTAQFSSTLKIFAIGSNQISNVPESISGLSNLEFLGLARNKITSIPESLINLTSLNRLFLTENLLNEIPNFRNHSNKENLSVNVQRNYLDFISLEKNLTGPGVSDLSTFSYNPQYNFNNYTEFNCSATSLVNDRAGGIYTHYKWLGSNDEAVWTEIDGGTTVDLDLSGGILYKYYKCEMINDRAVGVTIYSSTFQRSLEGNVPDVVEIAALKALYESTGSYAAGEGWNTKWPVSDAASWANLTSLDQLSGWHGLSFGCGDIIEINLPATGLVGDIPEQFSDLSALRVFNARENLLKSLPSTFGNLVLLEDLNLSYNSFPAFPEVTMELPALEFLNLIGNSIQTIPSTIGTAAFAPTLKSLAIGLNLLTEIPESIGNLSVMEFMGFFDNQITAVPETLLNIATLERVILTRNNISSIPNFRTHPNKASLAVYVHENYLDFVSLEQNLTGPGVSDLSGFVYVPQFSFGNYKELNCSTTILVNDRAGGIYTHYKWLGSDDETVWTEIDGGTTADLDLSMGISYKHYKCEMTNDRATNVTIYSSTFRVPDMVTPVISPAGPITLCAPETQYLSVSDYNGSYQWLLNGEPIDGATSNSYKASVSGQYSINVCGYLSSPVDVQIFSRPVISGTSSPTTCSSSTDGAISFTVTADRIATFNYVITLNSSVVATGVGNYGNKLSFDNLGMGTYTVQIEEPAAGCMVTQQITVPNSNLINTKINSTTQTTCSTSADGGFIFTVSGGGPASYNYTLSTGESTVTTGTASYDVQVKVDQLSAGSYTLQVKDPESGCMISTPVAISNGSLIGIHINNTTPATCDASSDGSVSFTATGGRSSSYTYNVVASGGELIASGTSSYNLPVEAAGFPVGTHTIELQEPSTGCLITKTFTIDNGNLLNITFDSMTPATCSASTDGEVAFTVSGGNSPSYNYTILSAEDVVLASGTGNYDLQSSAIGFPVGTHTLVVEDPTLGCEITKPFTIQNGGPVTSICASSVSCIAQPDGSESSELAVTVSRLRGIGNDYNYEIRNINNQVVVNGAGIFDTEISPKPTVPYTGEEYTFYVLTGADNTCPTSTESFSVEKANMTVSTDQPIYKKCAINEEVTVSVLPSLSTTSCTELPQAVFNVTIEKDGQPFETLTGVPEPIELTIVPSGQYTVTLTGQYGAFTGYQCTATTSFTVEDAYLSAEVVVTQPTCNDPANDGRATAKVTGGSGPYTYKWYGGTTLLSTLPEVTALEAGTYRLEVTGRYCENPYVEEFTIVAPSPIGNVTIQPPAGNCDMSATLSPAGGAGPYDFYWITLEEVQQLDLVYDPATQQYLPTYTTGYQEKIAFVDKAVAASGGSAISFTTTNIVKPGQVKVRVVDAKGCKVESSPITIEQPAVIRDYAICFRWKTPAVPEQNEPDPNVNVISNTIVSSRSMSKAVMAQAEECISGKVAEFGAAYDAYCLSADFLNDKVSFSYDIATYHHTLYYHDRAGNLVRTVPPKGVNPLLAGDISRVNTPKHTLITNYNYNNLGQLVRQSSPDGGQSRFIYNNLGQLRFSQNANQLNESAISYTKYDEVGRPVEVGEADLGIAYTTPGGVVFPNNTFDDLNQESFLDLDKETYQSLPIENRYPTTTQGLSEQTITIYNQLAAGIDYNGEAQSYLRNRVSYTEHINKSGEKVSTYYSYDPHGNVTWLSQDVPGLGLRKMGYDYDLLSGNVVKVKYNEGEEDQFFHKYAYDEDNRIKEVFTSRNNLIWERDAAYEFFKHGPLKRAVIGDNAVQGLDYAYTIHGWLKALNNPSDPTDPAAKDAFGMTLGYYAGDFFNNGSSFNSTANDNNLPAKQDRDLFNGNISSWQMANLASDQSWMRGGYQYEYDKLNRIRNSEFSILKEGTFYNRSGFHADFTLDPNGNLEILNRNDIDGERMDALRYHLIASSNKLEYVDDLSTIEVDKHKNDLEDQAGGNYIYDAIGNLVRDNQQAIDIDWTVYGKVKGTQMTNGTGTDFLYDAAGNRVVKKTRDEHGNLIVNFYVRDASGNVMAIYKEQNIAGTAELKVQEIPIYGSDRLGMYKPEGSGANGTQVKTQVTQNTSVNSYQGVSYDVAEDIELTLEPGFVFISGVNGNKFNVGNTSETSVTDPVVILDKKVYELKDHLGNIRAVISDRKVGDVSGSTPQEVKPAILSASAYYPYGMDMPTVKWGEVSYLATYDHPVEEYPDFLNYGDAQRVELYNHTVCEGCTFSQQLTAGAGSIIGLARSLKVQAGDQVDMEVYGRYTDPNGTDPSEVAAAIGSAFIDAFNVPASYEGFALQDNFNTLFADGSWIDDGNTLPVKAYLNYLLYDNSFALVKMGAMPVTDAAGTMHEQLAFEVPILKDGYIYIYLSNESEVITPVYFDDFKITHKKLVPDVDLSSDLIAYRYGFNGKEKDQSGEWGGGSEVIHEEIVLDDEFDNTSGWEINSNSKPTWDNETGENWCCSDQIHTSGTLSLYDGQYDYPTGAARKSFPTEAGAEYRVTVEISQGGKGGVIYVGNESLAFNTDGIYELLVTTVEDSELVTINPNDVATTPVIGDPPTLVESVKVEKLTVKQVAGGLAHYDYGFRIYNPAIGRFLSVDPLTASYPWYTPYQFAGNTPIQALDLDGLEEYHFNLTLTDQGQSKVELADVVDIYETTKKVIRAPEGWLDQGEFETIKIKNRIQKFYVTFSYDDYDATEVLAIPVVRKITIEFNSKEEAISATIENFDEEIESEANWRAIRQGFASGLGSGGRPSSKARNIAVAKKSVAKVATNVPTNVPNKVKRPYLRNSTINEAWELNKNSNGKVIDPSGKEISWDRSKPRGKQWHMGHKFGKEFRHDWSLYKKGYITWDELKKTYNDPTRYRPELPATNMSHKYEKKE